MRRSSSHFNPRAPCGARRAGTRSDRAAYHISTHAPLAGRDTARHPPTCSASNFNPRAPCGARPRRWMILPYRALISTHAPLAGRDNTFHPLFCVCHYFNPRAPCGARRHRGQGRGVGQYFNPRAPCGARLLTCIASATRSHFNPRAPCGARPRPAKLHQSCRGISTHAPLAGRDMARWLWRRCISHFNPRAPCGARQQKCTNHYAHFCDNRQISDAFAQNAACQGILLLFDAGKPCGFWVRTAQVISAHLCFAL